MYACCITGKPFDPNYANQLREKRKIQDRKALPKPIMEQSLTASIS
jgi:hypothetical protein